MIGDLGQLLAEIALEFPDVDVSKHVFESGAAMIDVRWRNRFVVIEYRPEFGFGVSMLEERDDGMSGHEMVVPSAAEAISRLRTLLSTP